MTMAILSLLAWGLLFLWAHKNPIKGIAFGERGGGGDTIVENPTPPAPASSSSSISDWANNLDKIYQAQLQYAPLQAQQAIELANQYATPYGQALKAAQEAMYPETSKLQEKLAMQASEGMDSEVPDWMRKEYLSNLNANLGTNIGAPIAADYTSRGLLQQKMDWQNYYRNLALSVAGRQPLTIATTPATTDYMTGYTPSTELGYASSTYSPYASAYSSMYNTNANVGMFNSQQSSNPAWAQALAGIGGSVLGGLAGGIGTGMGYSMLSKSSKRYKENIKLWAEQ